MAYHHRSTLVARRGYSGLGDTPSFSVKAVVKENATLTTRDGTLSKVTVPKGTTLTLVALSPDETRLRIGGAVGPYYNYWIFRNHVTEPPSTASKIGGSILDFFKGAGGQVVKDAAGNIIGKYTGGGAAAPPPGTISARGSLLTPTNMAIAGGGVLLLILLMRRKGS